MKTQQERTYIIAEIGINHEGSVDRCAEMIMSFAKAGANGVKLQSVDADRSYAEGTESYKLFSSACLTQAKLKTCFSCPGSAALRFLQHLETCTLLSGSKNLGLQLTKFRRTTVAFNCRASCNLKGLF